MADINEIISQEAINGLLKAAQAAQALDSAVTNISKTQTTFAEKTKAMADAQKEAEKIAKDQAATLAALDKQRQKAYEQIAKQEAKERELADAISMQVQSIADAEKQNKALLEVKKKLNLLTEEGRKKNEEYNKALDKNTEFIRANSDAATKQRMNIGNYASALEGLPGPIGNATSAASSFGKQLWALVANPIVAIIAAIVLGLTAMWNVLKGFAPVMDLFEQATAAIGAALKVVQNVIGSIINGAQSFKDAFKGMGSKMKEAAIEAANLKKKMQDLDDLKVQNIVTDAKAKRQIDELLLQSKDLTKSQTERTALIDEALKIEEEQYNKRVEIAKQETEIALGKIAEGRFLTEEQKKNLKEQGVAYALELQNTKNISDEEVKALADALANEESILNESVNIREKAINKKNALIEKSQEEEKKRQEDEKKRNEEIAQMRADQEQGFRDELQKTIIKLNETGEIIDETFDIPDPKTEIDPWMTALEQTQIFAKQAYDKTNEAQKIALEQRRNDLDKYHELGLISEQEYQAGITSVEDEERKRRLQAASNYVSMAAQIGNQLLEISQMNINNETASLEKAKAHELSLVGDNKEKIALINAKYASQEKALKIKAAKQNKAASLFNAIIGTAQAVINGLATMPFFPLGIIMGALAGVLGAVQIGLIASQPIPQFAKGTRSARRGLALVGERGRELIMGSDGQVMMSPGTASLMSLRGGERILSNPETERLMLAARGADDHHSRQMLDLMHSDNLKLIEAVRNKPVLHIDAKGNRITERSGNYYRTYLNKKLG